MHREIPSSSYALPPDGWVISGFRPERCSWHPHSTLREFNGIWVCEVCDPTDQWAWHIYEEDE